MVHLVFNLLLCTLVSFSILTTCKPLQDADGNHLQTGTEYYMLPFEGGNGGGLALSAKDYPCPFYVKQENHESSNGHPLRFFSSGDKTVKTIINSMTDVNVVFIAETICVESTGWKVGGIDWSTGHRYVMSSGLVGNHPGAGTLNSSWFKFEKHEKGKGYKVVFCPSPSPSPSPRLCKNLGVFEENGTKWLGLSAEPLAFQFKKA